jgi:hypothetical protein
MMDGTGDDEGDGEPGRGQATRQTATRMSFISHSVVTSTPAVPPQPQPHQGSGRSDLILLWSPATRASQGHGRALVVDALAAFPRRTTLDGMG